MTGDGMSPCLVSLNIKGVTCKYVWILSN